MRRRVINTALSFQITNMEEILTQIIIISNNLPDIQKAAREAVDFLSVQQGLIRDPAYELREKCLSVLQLCLETKRSKFTSLAIAGIHKIIRDDRFHSNIEPEDDSKWLPVQLLNAANCFLLLPDDTQVEILKILLNIACSKKWTLNGRIIILLVCLCSDAFKSGNAAVRAAAQAAASQSLRSFCLILEEELEEEDKDASHFNEIIPVMQFICSKIEEARGLSQSEQELTFLLECLLTLCSSLPQIVQSNKHLQGFLWQRFCPVLISFLGTPRVDKRIVTRNSEVEKERGRGSGCLGTAPSFNSSHARIIYSINTELVRLFGRVSNLRSVLESVFHRGLLYPAPEHTLDALKAVSELIRNPNRILDITGPLIEEKESLPTCDMSLLRLIMDSVEEGSRSMFSVLEVSVKCCFNLLKALEELCLGRCLPSSVAETICSMYGELSDCDYTEPKFYQIMGRPAQACRHNTQEKGDFSGNWNGNDSSDDTDNISCNIYSSDEFEKSDDEDVVEEENKKVEIGTEKHFPEASVDANCKKGPISFENCDRNNARDFIKALHELLPLLMPLRSSIQVDQALEAFSSQYCEGVIARNVPNEWEEVSADGIYLAVYSVLLLDMSLSQSDYYASPKKQISITEEDFVKKVQSFGIVFFLSSGWLRELYQAVVSSSLLETHGYLPTNSNSIPHALINLLTDVQGLGSCQQGSQMLWDCMRLKKTSTITDDNLEGEAGLRLSRRILTCSWDTILRVLAVPLSKGNFKWKNEKLRDLKFLGKEDHRKRIKQTITTSMEGLQIAARLCNNLGLQDRCGGILELLASASCAEETKMKSRLMGLQTAKGDVVRLTPCHALSLDLLLSLGLELGSHCSQCWPHVFRSCIYVKKLEHMYFSKSENRALSSTTSVTRKTSESKSEKDGVLTFDPQLEEDSCVDVYSFLCSSELPQTVSELVSTADHDSTTLLKHSEMAKVICVLSQLVDRLFEEAALKLNLKSLESFTNAFCTSSHEQLFSSAPNDSKSNQRSNLISLAEYFEDTLLLDSVGEIMLKCVRSGRPLFHIIKIWTIIGAHLTECTRHKDLTVSRKAVKYIHDIINAILSEHSELPHFHINEILFKPFEYLLSLELCEPDIQDQIVSCICEFVETSFTEIRSGWRPLFGALRAVSTNMNIMLDVFRVFLETDNVLVFSEAAVDYITCLLKHLRTQSSDNASKEIGFETLKYIKRFESILESMYNMPNCLVLQSAQHIQVSDGLLIDPVIADLEAFTFENLPTDLKFETDISYSNLLTPSDCGPSLDVVDGSSGILRVRFLLLKGIYSAAISANAEFQPTLLETVYTDLAQLIDGPGPVFGLIVFNRFILPMTQSWLRQMSKCLEGSYSGLKHSIGLLSDVVLQYFDRLQGRESCERLLTLLLNQVLLLLSECCVHPIPSVAKIGPASMRHIIVRVGRTFNCDQWNLVALALHRTCNITLTLLRQLMAPFSVDSQYYYGDAGQVKVAARKSSSTQEVLTSMHLSQQVFLLDEQREDIKMSEEDLEEQKIYTFLVSVSDNNVVRIPMKLLVIALLSHQSILQIVADILLQGTKRCISSLANILNKNNIMDNEKKMAENDIVMPGLMGHLKATELKTLLSCLEFSYRCALAFDSRPGLKFLIQKVAGLEQAANLYRQAGAAWAIKLVSLFEYCMVCIERLNVGKKEVKEMLENSRTDSENDLHVFLNVFRKGFNELCDTYINVVSNNYPVISPQQEKPEKPIFFLITSQDEQIPEICSKKESDLNEKSEEERKVVVEKVQKPFALADFAKKSSESCSEIEDQSQSEIINTKQMGRSEEETIERDSKQDEIDKEPGNDENKKTGDENSILLVLNEYSTKKKTYSAPRRGQLSIADTTEPSVPPEIEQQRRKSFLKDSEALRRVWTEMLGSVFELLNQLSDDGFQKLLPIFIDGVRRLMAHVSEPVLKQAVSELFQRIAVVYGFGTD